MKRILMYTGMLLVCLLPTQLDAMKRQKSKKRSSAASFSIFEVAQKYFNVANLGGRLMLIKSEESAKSKSEKSALSTAQKRDVLIALVRASYLEKFPIAMKAHKYHPANRYFDCDALKDLIVDMITDQFREKPRNPSERAASYLTSFKECLDVDAIKKDLGKSNAKAFLTSLDATIAYYSGEEVPVERCLTLAKLPPIFGVDLQKNFNMEGLSQVINCFLQQEPITNKVVLECFKFNPFLTWMGFKKKDHGRIQPAFCGLIAFLIDFANNDKSASDNILSLFANYGKEAEIREVEETKVKKASSSKSKSDSDDSDSSSESDSSSDSSSSDSE